MSQSHHGPSGIWEVICAPETLSGIAQDPEESFDVVSFVYDVPMANEAEECNSLKRLSLVSTVTPVPRPVGSASSQPLGVSVPRAEDAGKLGHCARNGC